MNQIQKLLVTMNSCSGLDERPVEEVSVVGDEDVRLHVQDVVEELLQQADLVLKKSIDEKSLCRKNDLPKSLLPTSIIASGNAK